MESLNQIILIASESLLKEKFSQKFEENESENFINQALK